MIIFHPRKESLYFIFHFTFLCAGFYMLIMERNVKKLDKRIKNLARLNKKKYLCNRLVRHTENCGWRKPLTPIIVVGGLMR